jgi:hypothetical protein
VVERFHNVLALVGVEQGAISIRKMALGYNGFKGDYCETADGLA